MNTHFLDGQRSPNSNRANTHVVKIDFDLAPFLNPNFKSISTILTIWSPAVTDNYTSNLFETTIIDHPRCNDLQSGNKNG